MRRISILLLLVLGCWHISGSGYMLAKAYLSQYMIKGAWEETLKDKGQHKPWSWADTYPVFELEIPRIDKHSYVLEGESGRNMAFSATHTSISGMPGENKSVIVSGHRDSHFDYLQHIKLGDEIIAKGKNGSFYYRVVETQIVDSKQKNILIKSKNELILTTCYPFDSLNTGGDLRYVIYAQAV